MVKVQIKASLQNQTIFLLHRYYVIYNMELSVQTIVEQLCSPYVSHSIAGPLSPYSGGVDTDGSDTERGGGGKSTATLPGTNV